MTFEYKALDKNGKEYKGKIEAANINEAKSKLKLKSLYVIEINEAKEKFTFSKKIPLLTLSNISRELSLYLKSGISLNHAIKLLKSSYEDEKKVFHFLSFIENYIEEGNKFYNAINNQKIFEIPFFYKESIKVAEDNGILQQVLYDLSLFLKDEDKLKSQISSSMAYPIFIIFVAISMVYFMITFIVPKIVSMFESMNQQLPTITQIVLSISYFLQDYGAILAILFLIGIIIFIYLFKNSYNFKKKIDTLLLKLPFFGKLIEKNELAKFSHIAALLSKSGVTFSESINLASNTLENLVLKELFQNASQKIIEGEKLSNALKQEYKIEKSFLQAMILAEETSQVKEILENISENYFEETNTKINILLSLIEPALMLIVGGVIGIIVTAMLLPIFSLNIGGL